MNASSSPDLERQFIAFLAGLAGKTNTGEERDGKQKNLAALAALRRGLGKRPGEAAEMFPYVVPFLGDRLSQRRQDDYFLVASLFAAHQLLWSPSADSREQTNLGASFRWLSHVVESGSIEQRFVALLNAARDDLPEHLRHAASLLKAHDIPIDWLKLLHDLRGWDWESHSIQRDWAYAYWRSAPPQSPTSPPSTAAPAPGSTTP